MKRDLINCWAYRLFLLAFPSSTRKEFGADMVQAFRDRCRAARIDGTGIARIWWLAIVDILLQATAERSIQVASLARRIATFGTGARRQSHDSTAHDAILRKVATAFSGIHQDIKHAIRSLVKRPGFTLLSLLILGLGIGANTAVFSVVNSVILQPLRYQDPDRLVRLYQAHPTYSPEGSVVSGPAFLDFREAIDVFEQVAGMYDMVETGLTLTGRGSPQRVIMLPVSANARWPS